MTPFLSPLPTLVPAPDGDLRPGGGVSEYDGAAAFATLLSGALLNEVLLRSTTAEGESTEPAGAVQEVAAEAGPSAEGSESTEADDDTSGPHSPEATIAAVSVPLAPTATTLVSTATPVSTSRTGEATPPARPAPARLRPALPTPSAAVSLSPLSPPAAATAPRTAEQALAPPITPDTPDEASVLAAGSEAAVEPVASDLSNDGPALPVEASMTNSANPVKAAFSPSPTAAGASMPGATAPSVDAEAQPSEPTSSTDLSEPTSPLDPTALEPTTLPTDSAESAPETAGDDTSTEPVAPPANDAEPATAPRQEGSFEGDGQSPQGQPTDEPLPLADHAATPTPDQAETDPSIPPMSEAVDHLAAAARAETPPSLQRTLPVAWLRAVLDQPLRSLTPGAARQSLRISLDDGEGTLTIETRRDNDRVSVAVAFSDGHLRSLASASVDRIHAVLQEHFGASVDLSLTSDGSGDAPPDSHDGRDASHSMPRADLAAPARTAASPSRARHGGGRHEWVG